MPELRFDFIANTSQLKKALNEINKDLQNVRVELGRFQALSANLKTVGTNLTKYVTAPLVALGGASLFAFTQVDNGLDAIRIGTGKTGKELEELNSIFMEIASTAPASLKDMAQAVADWNTRLDISGPLLKETAELTVDLADLLGENLGSVIEKVAQSIQKWNLNIKQTPDFLNHLFKVAQATGISITDLGDQLARNENVLEAFGLNAYESASFIGLLYKKGIDTSRMFFTLKSLIGENANNVEILKKAIKTLTDETIDNTTKQKTLEKVLQGVSSAARAELKDALNILIADFKSFEAGINSATDSIEKAREDTWDFAESFVVLKNRILLALQPLGQDLAEALENLQPALQGAVQTLANLTEAFSKLPAGIQKTIIVIGGFLALLGPVLLGISQLIPLVVSLGKAFASLGTFIAGGALLKGLASLGSLLVGLINPITTLIAAAGVAIGFFVKKMHDAKKAEQEFRESAETPMTIQLFDPKLQKKWREAIKQTEKTTDAFDYMAKNISYSSKKANVSMQLNIKQATEDATETATKAIDKMVKKMITTLGMLTDGLTETGDDMQKEIEDIVKNTVNKFNKLPENMQKAILGLDKVFEDATNKANKLLGIKEPFDEVQKTTAKMVEDIQNNIRGMFDPVLPDVLTDANDNIQQSTQQINEQLFTFSTNAQNTIAEGFNNINSIMFETTTSAVDTTTQSFLGLTTNVTETMQNLADNTKAKNKEVEDSFTNTNASVTAILDGLTKNIENNTKRIGVSIDSSIRDWQTWDEKVQESRGIIEIETGNLQELINQTMENIGNTVIPTAYKINGTLASVMTDVTTTTKEETDKQLEIWNNFVEQYKAFTKEWAENFSDSIDSVILKYLEMSVKVNKVTDELEFNALDWQGLWKETTKVIGDTLGDTINTFVKAEKEIDFLGNKIKGFDRITQTVFNQVGDAVGQFFWDLTNDSENALSNLGKNMAKIFLNFLSAIEAQVLAAKAAGIATAIAQAPVTFGASLAQIPGIVAEALIAIGAIEAAKGVVRNIAGLAEGGIVTQPTFAMIGEGGEPEAVIPLSKLEQFVNPNKAQEIHLHVGTLIADDYSLQELAEKLNELTGYRGYTFESRI